jgi:serine/threonine protein kinase
MSCPCRKLHIPSQVGLLDWSDSGAGEYESPTSAFNRALGSRGGSLLGSRSSAATDGASAQRSSSVLAAAASSSLSVHRVEVDTTVATFGARYVPWTAGQPLALRVVAHGHANPPGSSPHVTYQLQVSLLGHEELSWSVFRRYSEFSSLRKKLEARGIKSPVPFPAKGFLRQVFDSVFTARRSRALEVWICSLVKDPDVLSHAEMIQFVTTDVDLVPQGLSFELATVPGRIVPMGGFLSRAVATGALRAGGVVVPQAVLPVMRKCDESSLVEVTEMSPSASGTSRRTQPGFFPTASSPAIIVRGPAKLHESESKDLEEPKRGSDDEMVTALSCSSDDDEDSSAPAAVVVEGSYSAPPKKKRVALESFDLLKVLGKGSFGKVMLVRHRVSHKVFAMKVISKELIVRKRQVDHTKTERSVLGFVRHPFIVGLHFSFQTREKLYFVIDYCAGGELFFHLSRAGRFSESATKFYAAQLVLALSYLHSKNVVYRDLKPENILFDSDGYVKLADFGLSKEGVTATEGSTTFCGTPEYLAPEILGRVGHGFAVDWWSLGMLIYEMLTGLPPWYTKSRKELYESLRSAELRFPSYVSDNARSLISGLLNRDPAARLGAGPSGVADIVRHPFFGDAEFFRSLLRREVVPPMVPRLSKGVLDTPNFEREFTAISPKISVSEHRAESVSALHFEDFTYSASPEFLSAEGAREPLVTAAAGGSSPSALFAVEEEAAIEPGPRVIAHLTSSMAASSTDGRRPQL